METTVLYERLMRRLFMLAGARSRHVTFRHGAVHLLDLSGSGKLPPVALLHGFSASGATQYGAMARLLRPHVCRVVVPDLPGHGSSSIPPRLDSEIMSDGIFAALDAAIHPAQPVVLFASSMSGGLAVRYAHQHPERVAGLMLCSPGGVKPTEAELRDIVESFRMDSHRQALSFVDRMFAEPSRMRQLYALGVRQQFRRPHLRALLGRVAEERFLEPGEIQSLEMPVHVIWGADDRILPQRHLSYFREHLPRHAVVETPPRFGHAPFLDCADELTLRLVRFIRRIERGREQAPVSSAA